MVDTLFTLFGTIISLKLWEYPCDRQILSLVSVCYRLLFLLCCRDAILLLQKGYLLWAIDTFIQKKK